jgi:ribosomal protein S18 acetylase RimI-like enzyme
MLDRNEVLTRFDAEMRREPLPDPGSCVERVGPIVRVVGPDSYVAFSDLSEANVREVVASQVEFFRDRGTEVEWKVFGHDRPADLEAILAASGFTPEEPETLVVFDLGEGVPEGSAPAGVEVRNVTGDDGARDSVKAHEVAFGPDDPEVVGRYLRWSRDPNQSLFVAYAEGAPVASGRIELAPGRSFASLWGGGTAPEYRHRGIYRSLVAARAALAFRKGYRFLTVDARATSRPILERLGFSPMTTIRGWVLRPSVHREGTVNSLARGKRGYPSER